MATISLDDIQPRFLWLDPASGKSKEAIRSVRARSAIVVVGVDLMQRIWVLDAWAARVGTNEIVKQFVDRVSKWGPVVAAYEDVGQQSLLFDPIMNEAEKQGVMVPLVGVTVTTKVDKNWRIRSILQPLIGAGRLIINQELMELKHEITGFPMSSIKDLIDACASACALVPPPQSVDQISDEEKALAEYLRNSGVAPSQIESRVNEVRQANGGDVHQPEWVKKLFNKGKVIRARS